MGFPDAPGTIEFARYHPNHPGKAAKPMSYLYSGARLLVTGRLQG